MKIKLDGEIFTIKRGEWVQTVYGEGEVLDTDEVYDTLIIKRGNEKVKVKSEQVIKIGGKMDTLVEFLDKNPIEGALKEHVKDGVEKPKLSLIPQRSIIEVAKVMGYGANKYAKYNYSEGAYQTTYTDAAQRHINKYLLNEDVDDESGLFHLAHAAACILMLLDNDLIKSSINDRNKSYKILKNE